MEEDLLKIEQLTEAFTMKVNQLLRMFEHIDSGDSPFHGLSIKPTQHSQNLPNSLRKNLENDLVRIEELLQTYAEKVKALLGMFRKMGSVEPTEFYPDPHRATPLQKTRINQNSDALQKSVEHGLVEIAKLAQTYAYKVNDLLQKFNETDFGGSPEPYVDPLRATPPGQTHLSLQPTGAPDEPVTASQPSKIPILIRPTPRDRSRTASSYIPDHPSLPSLTRNQPPGSEGSRIPLRRGPRALYGSLVNHDPDQSRRLSTFEEETPVPKKKKHMVPRRMTFQSHKSTHHLTRPKTAKHGHSRSTKPSIKGQEFGDQGFLRQDLENLDFVDQDSGGQEFSGLDFGSQDFGGEDFGDMGFQDDEFTVGAQAILQEKPPSEGHVSWPSDFGEPKDVFGPGFDWETANLSEPSWPQEFPGAPIGGHSMSDRESIELDTTFDTSALREHPIDVNKLNALRKKLADICNDQYGEILKMLKKDALIREEKFGSLLRKATSEEFIDPNDTLWHISPVKTRDDPSPTRASPFSIKSQEISSKLVPSWLEDSSVSQRY